MPHANPIFGQRKTGTIGVPLPDTDAKIVDLQTGADAPAGAIGELVVRGPQVMKGYWKKPEETRNALRNGWLYTGDIGYMDDDGYLFLTSRKKDLIKPSGHQVWPREVEEVIATHPAVAEVSVAGIFDAKQGEAVKAWVVLKADKTATAEEIQVWCKAKLVSYKIPRFIEFRDALPKTMVGKVLRRVLVEEENAKSEKVAV